MDKFKNLLKSPGSLSFLSSLVSILFGLLFGFVLLLILNADLADYGMKQMLTNGASTSAKFAKVLYQAAPLIMTGLSVGFAFKTGLFNIGATGQYTVGGVSALICAVVFQMPWFICILTSIVAGAIWGFFPGFFKARYNVNEVITSIMFNWIALFLVNLVIANIPEMLANAWGDSQLDRTPNLAKANPDAIIPKGGLDEFFGSNYMNISIFIAIFFAIIIWVIMSKTTFGYELRACGLNRNASTYAGINSQRNIVLSMVIAGALSGVGGALYYQAGLGQYTLVRELVTTGFNGIPVALLASSNPIGIIFSALFVSYIQVGGEGMQPEFNQEVINIIIAVIIYLAAFSLLIKNMISSALSGKKEAAVVATNDDDNKQNDKQEEDSQ